MRLHLVIARVGLIDARKAVDFGLVIELAHRDRPMLLSIGNQEVGALLHLGPFGPISF